MLRIVTDTSVVISAILQPQGKSFRALSYAVWDCTPLSSFQTHAELLKVLQKPKFKNIISLEVKIGILESIETRSENVFITSTIKLCRDPNDDMFLNLAIDGKADVIISRDPDLLVLHPFKGIPILSPADFLHWVENQAKL